MIPVPSELTLHQQSKVLDVLYADGTRYALPAEYLRVHSPSAEVQGHGPGQRKTVYGKRDVGIAGIDPIGSYAVRLRFDDGHDTGLYSWKILDDLGSHFEVYQARYLAELAEKGLPRENAPRSLDSVVKNAPAGKAASKPLFKKA